jgi:hypothetical protein
MDTMTRKEIMREISTLSKRIFEVQRQLSDFTGIKVDEVTPYKETKTTYIGDTEITFYDVPEGNVTVFFDKPYTMEKVENRITVSFEELEEVTEITISIL